MPTLTSVLVSACTRKDQCNLKEKTLDSIQPAITTLIGKCLGIYSRRLSALRSIYSLILSDGGITDSCMNRLAKLYDTVTHQNIIGKVNDLAGRFDAELQHWNDFSIVFDNVDMMVKPRREAADKSNQMYHMVQAIAVQDRVVAEPGACSKDPKTEVESITPQHVYPDNKDDKELRQLMVSAVVRILREMPALQTVEVAEEPPHRYTPQTSKKSRQVGKFFPMILYSLSQLSKQNYRI